MSDYISIKDDRFWEILFDEACVEGKQAERIQKELEKIAVDEKEIIRKPMERIIERLEGLRAKPTETVYDTILVGSVIEIVKEVGGIE